MIFVPEYPVVHCMDDILRYTCGSDTLNDHAALLRALLHTQASNMMRVVGLVSLLVLQSVFCTVSAVSTCSPLSNIQPPSSAVR